MTSTPPEPTTDSGRIYADAATLSAAAAAAASTPADAATLADAARDLAEAAAMMWPHQNPPLQ